MTPQLYQAIKIMALPIQDLRNTIQEELEKNAALEVIEDRATVSLEEEPRRGQEDYDYFEDTSDPGYAPGRGEEASDSKRKFIEGVVSRPESLQDHLLWQLRLQPISQEEYRIGEMLIRNLDDNGFHVEPAESLVAEEKRPTLYRMMEMVSSFDPVGVCTKDYREALLVQIRYHPTPHPRATEVVSDYLELLEKGKYRQIARRLKVSEADVRGILEFIRELDPMPGRNFSSEAPRYVVPDIMVRLQDGEFLLYLNDEEIPSLGINPFFTDLLSDKSHAREKDLKQFVHHNIQDARWFIRSIQQRNLTLLKVCKAIIEFQREFFRRGPKYLVPLTLKDIAKEIGVHEATVSRVTSSKYIQTEWGIFELKYFFTNSVPGSGTEGTRFSKEGVKEMIREIIEAEGKEKHLTDKRILEVLYGKGVRIARRTVAKYRKELDIMSSYGR
jgi:RNA polymerase sigma-54 factor